MVWVELLREGVDDMFGEAVPLADCSSLEDLGDVAHRGNKQQNCERSCTPLCERLAAADFALAV